MIFFGLALKPGIQIEKFVLKIFLLIFVNTIELFEIFFDIIKNINIFNIFNEKKLKKFEILGLFLRVKNFFLNKIKQT